MPRSPALDLPQRVRAWTYQQQRLSRPAADPAEGLREVVAVYSSHPSAPLSLCCRSVPFDAARFQELEQRREAIRIPAMRGSIFLVPTETAPRLFATTRQPLQRSEPSLRYAGLDWDDYERLKPRILEHMQEPISAAALNQAIPNEGQPTIVARVMAREGLVLRLGTSLRSDNLRYVATDTWLGHPLEDADPDASLIWLAEVYLRAFGPARLADFAWWSGVTRRRAAAALAAVETVDLGDDLLLPADQHAAFTAAEPLVAGALALLPKWDPYTMGHAPDGRRRLLDDEHLIRAYTGVGQRAATSGDGLPLILQGGRAVASWSHRFDGNRLRVEIAPFDPGPRAALAPALRLLPLPDDAFAAVALLLGATTVDVVTSTSSP